MLNGTLTPSSPIYSELEFTRKHAIAQARQFLLANLVLMHLNLHIYSHTFLSPTDVLLSSSFSLTATSCLTCLLFNLTKHSRNKFKKKVFDNSVTFQDNLSRGPDITLNFDISQIYLLSLVLSFTGGLQILSHCISRYLFLITVRGSFLSGKALL